MDYKTLKSVMSNRDKIIAEQREITSALKAYIEDLEETIKDKEQRIAELTYQLVQAKEEIRLHDLGF